MNDEEKKSGETEFLSRWSRLKQEAREPPPAPPPAVDPAAPVPVLPPVEELTIDSDFSGFFHPGVDENVRRAALKKLFSDPHFNIMDGLDTYIDDYSQPNVLPAAMLAGLRQAQNILAWAKETEEETAARFAPPAGAAISPPADAAATAVDESVPPPPVIEQAADVASADSDAMAPERKS